jgi:formiminotetrahydrofolate cyclodeaminase
MRVVQEWEDWKLFCQEDGKYLLVRFDRTGEIKTLQINLSAVDDTAAVNDSEGKMKDFKKKKPGPASHINRLL